VSPLIAGLGGILLFAAAWELAGRRPSRRARRIARALAPTRPALLARGTGALAGGLAFLVVAPAAPGRLVPPLGIALVAAGALAPAAHRERALRARRGRIVDALPDALDLLAVGAAAGRGPGALLEEIATTGEGPLASELAITVAEIETGIPVGTALERLRARTGSPELGSVVAALERSRRFGSPLADQLHAQAGVLRRDERRRIEERAARAAPKIQLVVALVLVPSALLAIAAALVAHADALFGAL
jgi:tight adherence protein C